MDFMLRFRPLFTGALAAAVLFAPVSAAIADDLPAFRKGLWEFDRTIDGGAGKKGKVSSRRCVDPGADMRAQNARMEKAGCRFSPYARSGNQYTMTAQCKVMGVSSNTKTVITVESDSAYRLTVDGETDGEKTLELMVAKRIGDC